MSSQNEADELTKHLAYAEAALMLIEGLMLTLLEQRVLTKDQIVATVESVIATKREMLVDHKDPEITLLATGVLRTLANSLTAAETQERVCR